MKYNVSYSSREDADFRRQVWISNLERADKLNQLVEPEVAVSDCDGQHTWVGGTQGVVLGVVIDCGAAAELPYSYNAPELPCKALDAHGVSRSRLDLQWRQGVMELVL